MSDLEFIPKLLQIARDPAQLAAAKAAAAADIDALDGADYYPENSCAITQYYLCKNAGIALGPPIYLAIAFVETLQKRGWKTIPATDVRSGKTRLLPGDVGTTVFGGIRHPGIDHVYLITKPMSEDENLIVDNQEPAPHFRYVDSTGGKSPTQIFLRAV